MSLRQQISLNSGYTRSVNLQRDQENIALVAAYLPTAKALQALAQVSKGFVPESAERSIALIGPYGSGKSAFALFLSALLSPAEGELYQAAIKVLQRHQVDPTLISQFQARAQQRAYLRLMINGVPGSLIQQLVLSMVQATRDFDWSSPELMKRLKSAQRNKPSMTEVLALLSNVQTAWHELGGTGVLLEIDELGKFLEFEAQHPQQQEIHLLQLLAEHAQQAHQVPLQLVVMLHQSFEQYSAHAGRRLRDEWQKIQGRFNAFAFVESAEQVLRVVEAAFPTRLALSPTVERHIQHWVNLLIEAQALPEGLDAIHAEQLLQHCYPLHPVTLLILPMLCQKAAQNERTLFTYLGSDEAFGFLSRLDSLEMGQWIEPYELYDYFLLNQSHSFSDPLTYKRWLEVAAALSRLDAGIDSNAMKLLKTIGLLNIIGAQRGLKASAMVLNDLFSEPDALADALSGLQRQSLITYRQFNQEYRVWQGSDFDIGAAMQALHMEFEALTLATTINKLAPLSPLLVRGVTIETGTLRSFAQLFIDRQTERKPFAHPDYPLSILFYLSVDEADVPTNLPELGGYNIVAVCPPDFTNRLSDAVLECLVLQELPNRYTEIHADTVVKYEHQQWLMVAEQRLDIMFRSLVESPEQLSWYLGEEQCTIWGRRDLQRELTRWMKDSCYPDAPHLHNDLINCPKPSTSAATGRKRLIDAMLSAADQPKLGIEKTPAELSIYLSVLARSGLHRQEAGRWGFYPPQEFDPACLLPLWHKIDELLGKDGQRQVPVQRLYQALQRPPFGVQAGILPVLLLVYLLVNQRSVAVYQEGVFCDELTPDLVEMLVKRPVYFSLERFDLSGVRGELFDRYFSEVIGKRIRDDASLLDIVKPLLRFVHQLPPYALLCGDVSGMAQRVRAVLAQAQSPGVLLFRSLPEACGIDPRAFEVGERDVVEDFIKQLVGVLRELHQAFPRLVEHWQAQLAVGLLDEPMVDLARLRVALRERYAGLDQLTPDQRVLGAFVRRITEVSDKSDEAWLMSVGTLLSGVPAEKWADQHRVQAELLLRERSQQVRDLERLRLAAGVSDVAGDAVLIRWVGQQGERSRVVQLSAGQRERVSEQVLGIERGLGELDGAQRLAVLALLLERLAD